MRNSCKVRLPGVTGSLEEVLMWNIFFNFFAFKLQEPDDEHEYFQIINLAKDNAVILVSDFTRFDQQRKHDQCKGRLVLICYR